MIFIPYKMDAHPPLQRPETVVRGGKYSGGVTEFSLGKEAVLCGQ
jgi:hypothetical protein